MQTISISRSPKELTLPDIFFIVDTVLVNLRRSHIVGHRFAKEGFLAAICESAPQVGREFLANLHNEESFGIPLEIQSHNGINFSSSEYQVNLDLSSLPIDDSRKEEYFSAVQGELETYFGI